MQDLSKPAATRGVPRVGAVLLAAGRGTRFGPDPKLLAIFDGEPLVRHAARAALASRARPIVVVIGAQAERVRGALDGLGLHLIENPDYVDGLSTSLRTGLGGLPEALDAALVILGDMPRIEGVHLDALIAAYAAAAPRPCAVVPVTGGRRGNPVLIDHHCLRDALATLAGDRGAGPILNDRDDVLEIAMDAAVAFDVDTPDALT